MKNLLLWSVVSLCALTQSAGVLAQEIDNTETLPDAKPGECYAKVITPARFERKSEKVLVREASERVEAIPAVYVDIEEEVVVREKSRDIAAVDAVFEEVEERVETRPAELRWTRQAGDKKLPVSPDALAGLQAAGIKPGKVEAGACFSEFFTEAEYETENVKVLTREASERIVVTDAEYETVEKRVLVKPASSEIVDVPAVYRVETESVLVEPARSVWKQGRGLVERVDNTTGEIMCLVEVPASYETITRTVLDKPATTRTVTVPPVYETYEKQRLVKPSSEKREAVPAQHETVIRRKKVADAGFFWLPSSEDPKGRGVASGREICRTELPAEFQTVKRLELKEPARADFEDIPAERRTFAVQQLETAASARRIPIPERTRTVTRQAQIEPSRLEWRKVLCDTNMTRQIVSSLQRALKREGFSPGPADGVMGQGTMEAVEAYQLENELDRGGLTYETLRRLEVKT